MKSQWHNLTFPPALLEKADTLGCTPLHCAILAGSLDIVKWLLTQKASLTHQNCSGQNALHLAAINDQVEILQLLLAQGAVLNTPDEDGNTALHLAAAHDSQITLAALLRAGSSLTTKNKYGQTARECIRDPATAACYDLVVTQLREKEAEALKAHGPLGVMLLQQQELIRQQQAELAQQKTEIAALRERLTTLEARLAPDVPASSPQKEKAAHSSGFGLFDEKKQAPVPAVQLPVGDTKPLEQLLKFVAEGEQDQAEALIKKDSKLLLAAGKVTDLSGRTFDNITAFQYTLWAMDYHMWTMIQKYLPKEAQAEQHALLESKGTAHGKHFDLQPLLTALKFYTQGERWCKEVGGAQKLLPAHVVNEYCRPDRSFYPIPTEWTAPLPRTRTVEIHIGGIWDKPVKGSWFTSPAPSESLGSSFAFSNSNFVGRMAGARGSRGAHPTVRATVRHSRGGISKHDAGGPQVGPQLLTRPRIQRIP